MSTDQFDQKLLYEILPSVRCNLVNAKESICATSEIENFKKQLQKGLNVVGMLHDKIKFK